jgi:nucleolar protein 56
MQLITNVLGSFVLKDAKIILEERYGKNPKEIADELKKTDESVSESENRLIKKLISTGNKQIFVSNPPRFHGKGYDMVFLQSKKRFSVGDIASKLSISVDDANTLMLEVNKILVRSQMRQTEPDQVIIQAVDCLNDIDEAYNRLVERLREWYSLHFPELDSMISSHDLYASLICDVGLRGKYADANFGLDEKQKERVKSAAADSLGVDFTKADLEAVSALAKPVRDLYSRRKDVESYIGDKMLEVAPNLTDLAGPILGARLISMAHGLKRLSTMPAGTIQILGAEDAFFRFLKTGEKPPKHGIIFQHPDIRGASSKVRGKLARTLAAKLALASRADVYGGKISDKLKKEFQKRVDALRNQ